MLKKNGAFDPLKASPKGQRIEYKNEPYYWIGNEPDFYILKKENIQKDERPLEKVPKRKVASFVLSDKGPWVKHNCVNFIGEDLIPYISCFEVKKHFVEAVDSFSAPNDGAVYEECESCHADIFVEKEIAYTVSWSDFDDEEGIEFENNFHIVKYSISRGNPMIRDLAHYRKLPEFKGLYIQKLFPNDKYMASYFFFKKESQTIDGNYSDLLMPSGGRVLPRLEKVGRIIECSSFIQEYSKLLKKVTASFHLSTSKESLVPFANTEWMELPKVIANAVRHRSDWRIEDFYWIKKRSHRWTDLELKENLQTRGLRDDEYKNIKFLDENGLLEPLFKAAAPDAAVDVLYYASFNALNENLRKYKNSILMDVIFSGLNKTQREHVMRIDEWPRKFIK